MTRHEDRFVVRSRVTREFPGKICERLQQHTRASVKFKLSCTVAITADIEKAFLTIGIIPADRNVLRFLWFKDPTRLDSPIVLFTSDV